MYKDDQAPGYQAQRSWKKALDDLFSQVELLALPTMPVLPPRLDDITNATMFQIILDITRHVAVFNAAGVPCTAQPVPIADGSLPASLQLVGPLHGEELLLATTRVVEAALG